MAVIENKQYHHVLQKIQKGKLMLSQRELKKSGKNNFQKFEYLELKDFMPDVLEICDELGLVTQLEMGSKKRAVLKVFDFETDTETKYVVNKPENREKDPNKYIQREGAIQTYCTRYLYLQMFEITVPDKIDAESGLQDKPAKIKKQVLKKVPHRKNKSTETPKQPVMVEYESVDEVIAYIKTWYIDHEIPPNKKRYENTLNKLLEEGKISEKTHEDTYKLLIESYEE